MSTPGLHVDDATLLRIVDGEPSDRRHEDHVAGCSECARRMHTLSSTSRELESLLEARTLGVEDPEYDEDFLEALAHGAPGRRESPRISPRLRWAAGLVLVATAVSVTPIRAWIAGGARTGWAWIVGDQRTDPPPENASAEDASEVVAVIEGGVLTLRLSGVVPPDSAVFRSTEERRARALLRNSGVEGELLVRADGFEVHAAGERAVVEVWTPPGIREVRVVRNGREVSRQPRGRDADWAWTWTSPPSTSDDPR